MNARELLRLVGRIKPVRRGEHYSPAERASRLLRSERAILRKIVQLRDRVARGQLTDPGPGVRLWIPWVMDDLDYSRDTVERGLSTLVKHGYLRRCAGRGSGRYEIVVEVIATAAGAPDAVVYDFVATPHRAPTTYYL